MDITNIYRISALIFPTDEKSLKRGTTIRKIIESFFVLNNNKIIELNNLVEQLNAQFGLLFSYNELKLIIEMNKMFNIVETPTDISNCNFEINLIDERFKLLQTRLLDSSLSTFIERFYKENQLIQKQATVDEVSSIIEGFLYHVFIQNLQKSKAIFKRDLDISQFAGSKIFTEHEKEIINAFLDYENAAKDKAIFDVGSLALEYVSINGNVDLSSELSNLRSKILYLDTNVIFRALGLNSSNRKERMDILLKKCLSTGQKLKISFKTNLEFYNAIEHALRRVDEIGDKRILFEKLDDDLIKDYYSLLDKRKSLSPTIYKELIMVKYDKFIQEYKIEIEINDYYRTIKGPKRKEVDTNAKQLMLFKFCYLNQAITDVTNIAMIHELRNGSDDTFSNTKYYLLTTDKKLTDWENYNSKKTPIAIYPSDWISILLKYVSRGENDYKSFVSFIKTVIHPQLLSPDKMLVTLDRIAEIAEDIEHQNLIYDSFVSNDFKNIRNRKTLKDVADFVDSESQRILEEELNIYKEKDAESSAKLIEIESEFDNLKSEFSSDKENKNKTLASIRTDLDMSKHENVNLKKELINHRLYKRRLAIIVNATVFLLTSWILFSYIFYSSQNNQIIQFLDSIDTAESSILTNVKDYFIVLPITLFAKTGCNIFNLFFGTKSKKEVSTIN